MEEKNTRLKNKLTTLFIDYLNNAQYSFSKNTIYTDEISKTPNLVYIDTKKNRYTSRNSVIYSTSKDGVFFYTLSDSQVEKLQKKVKNFTFNKGTTLRDLKKTAVIHFEKEPRLMLREIIQPTMGKTETFTVKRKGLRSSILIKCAANTLLVRRSLTFGDITAELSQEEFNELWKLIENKSEEDRIAPFEKKLDKRLAKYSKKQS
jgi:hypothetical protein